MSFTQIFFNQNDISGITTSFVAMMSNQPGKAMGGDGEVSAMLVNTGGDVGASGHDYVVELYVNRYDRVTDTYAGWATTGISVTISGSSGTQDHAFEQSVGVSFGFGDMLHPYEKRVSTLAAVPSSVTLFCDLESDG